MKISDDDVTAALARVLDRSSLRAGVVASNLANLDTPGYRARDVRFEDEFGLSVRLARTSASHLKGTGDGSDGTSRFVDAPVTRMRADGNTVDLDAQMHLLSRERGRYGTAADLVRKRFALFQYAIGAGGGGR